MTREFLVGIVLAVGLPAPGPASGQTPAPAAPEARGRAVALTFDDLPATRSADLGRVRAITRALVAHLESHGIPAIGFVNESKLEIPSGEREERIGLLEAWLDAGLDLGNHTYSHARLYDVPLEAFRREVLRGERLTRRLLERRGKRPRYFRHPTLNTGPDLETKAAFEDFLDEHGYVIAPVTIDNDEYLYAVAYERARDARDEALVGRVAADYLRYMEEVFAFYEALSRRVLGREPAQVLLLHANELNAASLPALLDLLRRRGYRFVSLADALADPAYELPDRYVGPRGPSWLQRWAITMGRDSGEQPPVPAWVRRLISGR